MIVSFEGKSPDIAAETFVAPNATVLGDVVIGSGSSIWYQCVIRGDVFPIRIGRNVNIQDLTMIHVTTDLHATVIEDNVTVGHHAVLHGCTLRKGSFVGMGAVLMDRVEIGEGAMVGAGSLVTEGTFVPPGMLALGSPAKVRRALTAVEADHMTLSAPYYRSLGERHLRALASSENG